MSFFERAPQVPVEQQHRMEDLAQAAGRALLRAGLPAAVVTEDTQTSGVNIFVDTATDEMGGVFAKWRASESLISAATTALGTGRTDDPVIRHVGSVVLSMCDAILQILVSAGFTARVADDDVRIMTVEIVAAPPE